MQLFGSAFLVKIYLFVGQLTLYEGLQCKKNGLSTMKMYDNDHRRGTKEA